MTNTKKSMPLKDFRCVTNKILYEKLKIEVMEQLRRIKDPTLVMWSDVYSVFVDFNNIGYIDVLYAIQSEKIVRIAIGSIKIRVKFLKVKTIDEVFEAYTSKEDSPFNIEETSYFYYQNEEDFGHRYYFVGSKFILNSARKFISPQPNDKLINIKLEHLKNTYVGYQNANNSEYIEIYDINDSDNVHFVKIIKTNELIQNKSKGYKKKKLSSFHNFFNTRKRNGEKYEKIVN